MFDIFFMQTNVYYAGVTMRNLVFHRNIRLLRQTTNNAIIRRMIAGKLKRFNKYASRYY